MGDIEFGTKLSHGAVPRYPAVPGGGDLQGGGAAGAAVAEQSAGLHHCRILCRVLVIAVKTKDLCEIHVNQHLSISKEKYEQVRVGTGVAEH